MLEANKLPVSQSFRSPPPVRSPLTLTVNTLLSLLTLAHLAYLGTVFDSSRSSEEGYSLRHALLKWGQLGYFSHVACVCTYAAGALL